MSQSFVCVSAVTGHLAAKPRWRFELAAVAEGFEFDVGGDEAAVPLLVHVQLDYMTIAGQFVARFDNAGIADEGPEQLEALFGEGQFLFDAHLALARLDGEDMFRTNLAKSDFDLLWMQREIALADLFAPGFGQIRRRAGHQKFSFNFHSQNWRSRERGSRWMGTLLAFAA